MLTWNAVKVYIDVKRVAFWVCKEKNAKDDDDKSRFWYKLMWTLFQQKTRKTKNLLTFALKRCAWSSALKVLSRVHLIDFRND